jgi:hypothetical protein
MNLTNNGVQSALACSDQRNGSPERQTLCKITESFLASATRALPCWILNCADIRECGQHADARHAHEQPAGGVRLHQYTDRFVENSNLFAQLPPGNEHGPDNQRDVGTVEQQSFNLPIEGQSPYRAG